MKREEYLALCESKLPVAIALAQKPTKKASQYRDWFYYYFRYCVRNKPAGVLIASIPAGEMRELAIRAKKRDCKPLPMMPVRGWVRLRLQAKLSARIREFWPEIHSVNLCEKSGNPHVSSVDFGEGYYRGQFKTYPVTDKRSVLFISYSQAAKLQKLDGIPTIILDKIHCFYFTHGRGKNWNTVRGVYINGFHAESIGEYRKAVKRSEKALKTNGGQWVTVEAAKQAGNCTPGIALFLSRAGINPSQIGAIRTDYLLELARKQGVTANAVKCLSYAK